MLWCRRPTFPPREMPPKRSSRQTSKETANEDAQSLQQPHKKDADQWICFINSEKIIDVIIINVPCVYEAVSVYPKIFKLHKTTCK